MAIRPIFCSLFPRHGLFFSDYVNEKEIDFEWFPGFSSSQKKKSILSLHEQAKKKLSISKILEVSTKSSSIIGIEYSAFNLCYYDELNKDVLFSVESAFQSSKVFKKGGPYTDILKLSSIDAKRDERLRNSGDLIYFEFKGEKWLLQNGTAFYDWLYINALSMKKNKDDLLEYEAFTDIEFNPKKSLNCQARSVALFVALSKSKALHSYLSSKENFLNLYKKPIQGSLLG